MGHADFGFRADISHINTLSFKGKHIAANTDYPLTPEQFDRPDSFTGKPDGKLYLDEYLEASKFLNAELYNSDRPLFNAIYGARFDALVSFGESECLHYQDMLDRETLQTIDLSGAFFCQPLEIDDIARRINNHPNLKFENYYDLFASIETAPKEELVDFLNRIIGVYKTGHKDPNMRAKALRLLSEVSGEEALRVMREIADPSPYNPEKSPIVKQEAADILAGKDFHRNCRSRDYSTFSNIIGNLVFDKDVDKKIKPALIDSLTKFDVGYYEKYTVNRILGNIIGNEEQRKSGHPDEEIRIYALKKALEYNSNPLLIGQIVDSALADANPEIRKIAIPWITRTETSEPKRDRFLKAMRDTDDDVRFAVAGAIPELRWNLDDLFMVIKASLECDDRFIRETAVRQTGFLPNWRQGEIVDIITKGNDINDIKALLVAGLEEYHLRDAIRNILARKEADIRNSLFQPFNISSYSKNLDAGFISDIFNAGLCDPDPYVRTFLEYRLVDIDDREKRFNVLRHILANRSSCCTNMKGLEDFIKCCNDDRRDEMLTYTLPTSYTFTDDKELDALKEALQTGLWNNKMEVRLAAIEAIPDGLPPSMIKELLEFCELDHYEEVRSACRSALKEHGLKTRDVGCGVSRF